jgi:hypothetical protein
VNLLGFRPSETTPSYLYFQNDIEIINFLFRFTFISLVTIEIQCSYPLSPSYTFKLKPKTSIFFQVHIRISSYQCGGVLLNHWYVATAAHCVHQAKLDQITVHLGEFDTKNTEAVRA